jgi:hypothetical protein
MFDGVHAGNTYVVSVTAKRFTFAQPSLAVTANDDVSNADFIANGP